MDLQDISSRAGLPVRRVRYVLDHRVLPGLRARVAEGRAGRPRTLLPQEGFWVAVAALLLQGGVQRRLVADVVGWLIDTPWPPPGREPVLTLLERAIGRARTAAEALYRAPANSAAVFEVGDGTALRVWAGGGDTGWIVPGASGLPPEYTPRVTVRLDLATLRAAWAGVE